MPQFTTGSTDNTAAGALGIAGAIPFVNVLTPGITNMLAQQQQDAARNAMARNAAALEGPEFANVSPDLRYLYTGDFSPEAFATPEAAQHALVQDSAEGRAAQLAALQLLGEQSDQAIDSTQALDRQRAMLDAAQFAQGREGLIRQDAARRGQIGGAADMIMRAQAAQMAANRNQEAGLQSAQMAALQRLAGTQAQAGLAGQLRGQDQNLAFANADIINRFNMANTVARNQADAANVAARNAAGLRNLDAQQANANRNTGLGQDLLARSDRNAMANYGAQMDKFNAAQATLGGQQVGARDAGMDSRAAGQEGFANLGKSLGMGGASMMGGGGAPGGGGGDGAPMGGMQMPNYQLFSQWLGK